MYNVGAAVVAAITPMQLFKKLVLILLAVGCLPLFIAGWLLVRTDRDALKRSVTARQQEKASALARTTGLELDRVVAGLAAGAGAADEASLRALLDQHRDEIDALSLWHGGRAAPVTTTSLVDDAAAVKAHVDAVAFTRPDPAHPVFTDPYESTRGTAISVIVPLHGGADFLAAELRLDHLQEDVAHTWIGAGGDVFLVDRHGRVVAARDVTMARTRADLSSDELVRPLLAGRADAGQTSGYVDSTGERWLAAWAPVPSLGWSAVVREPEAEALAPASTMLREAFGIALATMLAALLAGVVFARRMADPLRRVVTGSLNVARGRFGAKVPVVRRDEIGELAHTFNYMSAQLSEYDKENKSLFLDLQRGYVETIRALANSIDAKDPYTRGHSQRVGDISVEIGRELGLTERELKMLQYGGILHDIGKIGIKEKVLGKSAPLTDEEYEYMKTHPLLGVGIIDPIEFLKGVKPIIRGHHERWDGKGYPDGLAGDAIDVGARIVNVADSYDAMVTHRPYNNPMTWEQAVARLKQIAGSQHDPKVTEAFLAVLARRRAEEQAGDDWRRAQTAPVSSQPTSGAQGERTGEFRAVVVELPKRSKE